VLAKEINLKESSSEKIRFRCDERRCHEEGKKGWELDIISGEKIKGGRERLGYLD